MKVKFSEDGIFCPKCKRMMFQTAVDDGVCLVCWTQGCAEHNKYYDLPEIEVKEHENRDGKKPD